MASLIVLNGFTLSLSGGFIPLYWKATCACKQRQSTPMSFLASNESRCINVNFHPQKKDLRRLAHWV
jgi:hypothetical protein